MYQLGQECNGEETDGRALAYVVPSKGGLNLHHRQAAPDHGAAVQVNSDRSITFRLDAPNAQRVELVCDITSDVLPFTKGVDGLWSVTTATLSPPIYVYDASHRCGWAEAPSVAGAAVPLGDVGDVGDCANPVI
jgi:hypothetical protein